MLYPFFLYQSSEDILDADPREFFAPSSLDGSNEGKLPSNPRIVYQELDMASRCSVS
jgi:hypothetical protein